MSNGRVITRPIVGILIVIHMKTTELLAIIFGLIACVCLASTQIRRILKGDLPTSGPSTFKAASKIKLDAFDKRMILIAAFSFALCIIFLMAFYW